MDAAVLDQLFQSQTGNLTADRVKARYGDGLGGVVDDQVAAGQSFDAADVAAFAADDASLHLVVGEGNDRDGDFAGVVSGTALNGGGDDLSGAAVSLFLVLGFHLFDLHGHLVGDILADVVNQIVLGLVHRKTGNLFEHFQLALLDQLDLSLLGLDGRDLLAQVLVFLFQGIGLAVQRLFLLLQAALLLLHLSPAQLFLSLKLRAVFVYFFLCLHESFAFLALGAFYRFIYNPFGLVLGTSDLAFGNPLAVLGPEQKAGGGQ